MQRHALGVLFLVLAGALTTIGILSLAGAGSVGRIVVGVASLAIAGWLASLSASALRR